jgi:hypothetical protein
VTVSPPRIRPFAVLGLCALVLAGCGNTLQQQPIPHNSLESLLLAPYPVYWLGDHFHGLAITEAARDPSASFTVSYGACLEGGQSTCVPPLRIVTSPDNSFIPGEHSTVSTPTSLRGAPGIVADRGDAISLATGAVVLNVYANTPSLARAAAEAAVPIDSPGAPRARLARALPSSGFGDRPLPSQAPSPLRALR